MVFSVKFSIFLFCKKKFSKSVLRFLSKAFIFRDQGLRRFVSYKMYIKRQIGNDTNYAVLTIPETGVEF